MATLAELPCLIFDCQSTGATPAYGVLLEMGWCSFEQGEPGAIRSAWVALPQGARIPAAVRDVTGYRDELSRHAVRDADLWRELCAAAADVAQRADRERAPTLIHFAQFEQKWLEDMRTRFSPDLPLPFDVACLHGIACRLYPDLPRRGLRALSGFLGFSAPRRSRSPDHVAASAFVWRALSGTLAERGIRDWPALVDFLATPIPKRGKKRVFPLPAAERRTLPDAPGVYRMLRKNGDVLYVGKALSVKKRIASHFSSGARATERALEMLTQVHRIDVLPTASGLEAALVEADEIKRLSPPYNVHLLGDAHRAWFASRDLRAITSEHDDEHPVGPLPSQWAAAAYGAVIALAAGAEATRELRARAVGVPEIWAPDADVFRKGWRRFAAERLAHRSRTPRGRVDKAARTLWLLSRGEGLDERPDDTPAGWDEPRVRRNLERALVSGQQLIRRARWLIALSDSVVVFREANAKARRIIVLSAGGLISRDELVSGAELPAITSGARSWRERQRAFEATAYDRLRVITTELKRVLAEGGDAEIRLTGLRGRDRQLSRGALARLFVWL